MDFAGRADRFALVSDHFFYFGAAAPMLTRRHRDHGRPCADHPDADEPEPSGKPLRKRLYRGPRRC